MAQPKKNIARLVLQGISILGILLGLGCFCSSIAMIFSFDRKNLYGLLMFSGIGLVLAAFLIYPSYKMLRGRSFEVLKSIAALLALTSFSFIEPFTDFIRTRLVGENASTVKEAMVDFSSFLLFVLVSVLVYKGSVKLLERLKKAAYGPKHISETQNSTDKQ